MPLLITGYFLGALAALALLAFPKAPPGARCAHRDGGAIWREALLGPRAVLRQGHAADASRAPSSGAAGLPAQRRTSRAAVAGECARRPPAAARRAGRWRAGSVVQRIRPCGRSTHRGLAGGRTAHSSLPLPPAVFVTREVERLLPEPASASRDWQLLDGTFRQRLLTVIRLMRERHGYELILLEGYRSPARQDRLASLGPQVTRAGAMMSYHQYGLAADIAFVARAGSSSTHATLGGTRLSALWRTFRSAGPDLGRPLEDARPRPCRAASARVLGRAPHLMTTNP